MTANETVQVGEVTPVSTVRSSMAGIIPAIIRGEVLLIEIDTVNPRGGRGGSADSLACAWLVRTLVGPPVRQVVVTTRHQSVNLTNDRRAEGEPPRVLAREFISMLTVRQNVVGWISGRAEQPRTMHHGGWRSGLWEATPSALGLGLAEWDMIRLGALRASGAFR